MQCNYCNEAPILGTRWHCNTCVYETVDFCSDCLVSQLYSESPHPVFHRFVTSPGLENSHRVISSDSDSESTNDHSNNISDSDASAYSSVPSLKSKQSEFLNGNFHEETGTNGLQNVEMDTFFKEFVFDENKEDGQTHSTSDIGYAYLRSNLSMND